MTADGAKYVREAIQEDGEVSELWAEYYCDYDLDTPQLDKFTQQYLETALWAENDQSNEQGGNPLDENYTIEDIDHESLKTAIEDCARFQLEHCRDTDSDPSYAGYYFWLTRNGHGAGFWDEGWPEPAATRLTKASEEFGRVNIYIGDDGKLYFN